MLFKPGDKVRCIKGTYDDFLTTDGVYIVKNSDTQFTEVEHDDWGNSSSHYTHRFELVKEEPEVNKVFKPGDKVRCIQSYGDRITKGRTYVVDDLKDNEWVRVKDIHGFSYVGRYRYTRFELVKEECQMKHKFNEWKIWNGGKCPVNPDTFVQVQTENQKRSDVCKDVEVERASFYSWEYINDGSDIIAYREVKQPEVKNHSVKFNLYNLTDRYEVYSDHAHNDAAVNFYLEFDEVDGIIDWDKVKVRKV